MKRTMTIFVDVDDTLIRTVGHKIIPITATIEHLKSLPKGEVELYCWSSGGAAYAQNIAQQLKIENLFTGFLPKPQVIIDDQEIGSWRYLRQIHPGNLPSDGLTTYETMLSF